MREAHYLPIYKGDDPIYIKARIIQSFPSQFSDFTGERRFIEG